MMKPIIKNILLDLFNNTLHFEECSFRNKFISEYFSKPKTLDDIEFLFSVISYLTKVEKNFTLELCPHCLGKSLIYNLKNLLLKLA